ncbi:MAG: D-ribose pyranase [Proteobacteria bacterium]|nr:D-ribose pyranase [Pseudomonadota bacterium]
MKRTFLLHAELSQVIASLGHGDMLVLGDAGLPIPDGPRRIDLAVSRGVPRLGDVLEAVLSEMQVEGLVIANEALEAAGGLPPWYPHALGLSAQRVSHEAFKRRTALARAVVRTGECMPYANLILVAGVAF